MKSDINVKEETPNEPQTEIFIETPIGRLNITHPMKFFYEIDIRKEKRTLWKKSDQN